MKNLSIEELVVEVNKLAITGMNLKEVEAQLGFAKKSLSKKLSKKYRFDRALSQYVPKVVTDSYKDDQKREIPRKENVTDVVIDSYEEDKNNYITDLVIHSYKTESKAEIKEYQGFKGDEVDILYKLIEEYRIKQKLQDQDEESDDKIDLANRNIRVYTKQYNKFADWCKANNVTQADALYKAIKMLMTNTQ